MSIIQILVGASRMLMIGVFSIREFCDLKTPIFMWDKNGDYVVKTLEEV